MGGGSGPNVSQGDSINNRRRCLFLKMGTCSPPQKSHTLSLAAVILETSRLTYSKIQTKPFSAVIKKAHFCLPFCKTNLQLSCSLKNESTTGGMYTTTLHTTNRENISPKKWNHLKTPNTAKSNDYFTCRALLASQRQPTTCCQVRDIRSCSSLFWFLPPSW